MDRLILADRQVYNLGEELSVGMLKLWAEFQRKRTVSIQVKKKLVVNKSTNLLSVP